MFRRDVLLGGVAIIALLAVFLLAACEAPTDPAPSEEEMAAHEANIAANTVLWSDSSHNNVWDQREGTNTYCARCHSPGNWDPDAMRGGPVPGSCFNCHIGPSLRTNALGNEAIAEEDFEGIQCSTCHEEGHGPDIAIWNNATNGYDAVVTSDELCGKCHVDGYGGFDAVPSGPGGDSGTADGGGTATSLTEAGQDFMTTVTAGMEVYNETDNSHATVSAVVDDGSITTTALTGGAANVWSAEDKYYIYEGPLVRGGIFDGTSHQIVVGGSAHPNEIGMAAADRGPSSCIECHDPHSQEASSCIDCHEDLSTASNAMDVGHDDRMAKVTCVACHGADPVLDAVGWVDAEARDVFTVGTMSVPRGGGAPVFAADNTHLINRTAKACTDCHTADNTWGIPVMEAEQPSGRPL